MTDKETISTIKKIADISCNVLVFATVINLIFVFSGEVSPTITNVISGFIIGFFVAMAVVRAIIGFKK